MISKKLSIVHCQLSIILAFLPLSVAYAQQDSTLNRTVVAKKLSLFLIQLCFTTARTSR